jgi:hypothetical protein
MMRGACQRVVGYSGDALECFRYETSPLHRPPCGRGEEEEREGGRRVRGGEGREGGVPLVYHAVGKEGKPPYAVRANAAANREYRLHYLNDTQAGEYVRIKCGARAHAAYLCFVAPAFRADLFRFCALHAEGGVYMDSDIVLLTEMRSVYSPCAEATIGYDFPWNGRKGKQMKILAGTANASLFACMIRRIVENVAFRRTDSPLSISGPSLLHSCYESEGGEGASRVALTYIDSRGGQWPYSGMRDGTRILAYEKPGRLQFGGDGTHYEALQKRGKLYHPTCGVPREAAPPPPPPRPSKRPYYRRTWRNAVMG